MTIPPIRRQIVVPIGTSDAFDSFTRDIGAWWPLDEKSVSGAGGTVAFVGTELVETSAAGQTYQWATVLEWVRGERLRLSWFPGHTEDRATELRLSFDSVETAETDCATLVTLEHIGWEHTADPDGARREYESGWPGVIRSFGQSTLRGRGTVDRTWLVLRHTAGAAAPERGPIFAHPDFPEHAAFLGRLAAAGVLVAAGPLALGDQPGAHGMTVIRVPSDQVQEYVHRATTDDQSVIRGLLAVETITWNVLMPSG